MTCYSEEIVREAFDPRTGLQTRQKWLPTVSEIREACERVAGERANRERREMLNKHRVLLDTPHGLRPESEVDPSRLRLAGPVGESEAERRQRAYEYAMQVKGELNHAGETPDPNKPPPGMTDAQKREWYAQRPDARLAEIKERNQSSPVVIGEGLAAKLASYRRKREQYDADLAAMPSRVAAE